MKQRKYGIIGQIKNPYPKTNLFYLVLSLTKKSIRIGICKEAQIDNSKNMAGPH